MDPNSSHHATGVGPVVASHRRHLCSLMEDSGFSMYDREWWHYTLRSEPYPDTYFDFPIAVGTDNLAA